MARRIRFGTWCKKDPDDERKIIYTFHMKEADGTKHDSFFTSEDIVSWNMLSRIREAWVKKIELLNNEFEQDAWSVELYED